MVPDDIANSRWGGQVDAHLEAIKNELLPLKPLPGHMALIANTVERMERQIKAEFEACVERDEAQDVVLEGLKDAVNKGNNRRAWILGFSPVVVALIGVAGVLLAKGGT